MPEKEQKHAQLKVALLAPGLVLLSILPVFLSRWYFIPILSLAAVITIVAPFFDVPSLKKQGKLRYFSPLFITEKESKGVITIHGGTLLDYVYVIDRSQMGPERTRFILKCYLLGLIRLIEELEENPQKNVILEGTSYIINERTARKIGFEKQKTNWGQTFLLLFNYLNITATYSLSKGKLSFPNVNAITTFRGNSEDVRKRKSYLKELYDKL